MFSADTYKQRREVLRSKIGKGVILLPGNGESPCNYPNNTFHFRQDSTCCDWSFLSACPESALHGPAQSTLWFWAWTTSPLGEAGLELQPLPSQCPHPLCSTVG